MTKRRETSPEAIRALADYAELPLAPGRERVIQPTLDAWIKDANELSRKMSAEKYRDLIPVTVFFHPVDVDESN